MGQFRENHWPIVLDAGSIRKRKHANVDGHNSVDYHNIHCEGYGHQPVWRPKSGNWLEQFTSKAAPEWRSHSTRRVSSVPRYAVRTCISAAATR